MSGPLGLPVGSVRSILVLALVVALVVITAAFAVRVIISSPEEVVERAFMLLVAALVGGVNLALGFYFASRSAAKA